MPFENFTVISTYTRQQAIEDGVLIDISSAAAEHGFKLHTVVTDNLYHQYLLPPAGLEGEGQSLTGRLHDLLTMAMVAARKGQDQDRADFEVLFLMRPGQHERATVILHVGPGDRGEAVLTLMLEGDD